MQLLLIVAAPLLSVFMTLVSPTPPTEKGDSPVQKTGPVQIDFSPLPNGNQKQDYKIHLVVETKGQPNLEETYTIGAGATIPSVRDTIKASLRDWKVEAVGDDKLVLRSYKGSPVTSVQITCEGVISSMWPAVSRVENTGPLQIDFSPLPNGNQKQDYKIHLVVETKGQPNLEETYTIGAGTTVPSVRDLIKGSLRDWKVEGVGDDKLVIHSYKDSPVTSVQITCEGVISSMWPAVSRVEEKKEKDK